VLLRPFPFPEPDRIVRLETVSSETRAHGGGSLLDLADWQAESRTLRGIALYLTFDQALTSEGPARQVKATFATPELFSILGATPHIGRTYTAEEDRIGGDNLKAVISYSLWRSQFASDPAVLGRKIVLRGASYEVIGVAPEGFGFPQRSEVWMPMHARYAGYGKETWWQPRDARWHEVIARLAPGATLSRARSEMASIAARFAQQAPDTNKQIGVELKTLREAETGALQPYLLLLSVAVALVLLIACLNVLNILLARALMSGRELGVRRALGAGRWSLLRLQLVDSLVLATLGGAVGLLFAHLGVRALLGLIPVELPFWMRIELDGASLAFNVAIAVAVSIAVAVGSATVAMRADARAGLQAGSRTATRATSFARDSLVVAQLAFSFVLLVGAELMVGSFLHLEHTETGFDRGGLVVAKGGRFLPGADRATRLREHTADAERIVERLSELPGVTAVGVSNAVPFVGEGDPRAPEEIWTEDQGVLQRLRDVPIADADVTPGFFATMRIPLLEGRLFDGGDGSDGERVTVISQRTAAMLWPGQSAIGRRLRVGKASPDSPAVRVIGVVGDTRWRATETGPAMELYYSYQQWPLSFPYAVVRTTGDPRTLVPGIRNAMRTIHPDLAVGDVKTMGEHVLATLWQRRLWGVILGAFSLLAVALSAIGLYGVMTFLVAQRNRELGVRMALGATPGGVAWLVLRRGLLLFGMGALVGIAAGAALSRVWQHLLFAVRGTDPRAFAGAGLLLGLITVAACAAPAFRAWRTGPAAALAEE